MQTFLPIADFNASARVLDNKRLGKQRVETYQLVNAIRLPNAGWKNHPAAKMWTGYESALIKYGLAMHDEWIRRGFTDNTRDRLADMLQDVLLVMPPWFGQESFHASHRSNLLRKDPVFYAQYGWTESADLPYIWPVS